MLALLLGCGPSWEADPMVSLLLNHRLLDRLSPGSCWAASGIAPGRVYRTRLGGGGGPRKGINQQVSLASWEKTDPAPS